MKKVFINAAIRTPLGSFLGNLAEFTAPQLMAFCTKHILSQHPLNPTQVTDLIAGQVLQGGSGQAPARQAVRFSGLSDSTRALTINKVCGSGLKAIELAYDSIQLGKSSLVFAGGMESMSNSPYYLKKLRTGHKMGNQELIDGLIHDGLWDPYNNFHMGNAGEKCATEFKFSRTTQDEFAIESFKRAQANSQNFKNEICNVVSEKLGVIDNDEGPSKAKFDKIPLLKPVFQKEGTITPANASTINDGAAVLLLSDEKMVAENSLNPLAEIIDFDTFAHAPEWFTTAPASSIKRILSKNKLKVEEISAFEINEAFAVVPLHSMKELNIPHQKTNIRGGAISLGHPIGCSGARLVVTLINILKKNELGLASLCIGGGEAISILIKKL